MQQKFLILCLILGAGLMLTASNAGADFVQCPTDTGICPGTDFADIINGTPSFNNVTGLDGDDSVFAGDNPIPTNNAMIDSEALGGMMFGVSYFETQNLADELNGGPGNDFLSGGPGHDYLFGEEGNDILLPGSDVPMYGQIAEGGPGNDTIIVFVGDTVSCLMVYGDSGSDTVNLIGFGPYSATSPYGLAPGFGLGWIVVVDPISGGYIFIFVTEGDDFTVEFINGLLSPNITFLPDSEIQETLLEIGCNVPLL